MKIALVTNKNLHHKFWINELYTKNNVQLIIHPTGVKQSLPKKVKQKKLFHYGVFFFCLKMLSLIYNRLFNRGLDKLNKKAQSKYFSKYAGTYSQIPQEIINDVDTVNSEKAINLIRDNEIDIICFLGGDIARKEFINSAKICLNFHSGVSPFYNGNKTNYHTVSDFRPNFAGGTLMKMNERIDGGEILMHYLCPIDKEDQAEDLFMKGIIGATKLYQRFLDSYSESVVGVKQKRSFKYVRNVDWTIVNDIRLKSFYERNRMKVYQREEVIVDYVNKGYDLKDLYGIILDKILYK